jgi:hypothetical protein
MAYSGKNLYSTAGKGDLTADDLNYFQTQKRRVNQTYGYGVGQNQWQRDSAKGAYDRSAADLKAQFGQMRSQLPSAYAKGGLLNSGIYARGLDRFQADRTRARGNLLGDYNAQLSGLSLADRQLESVRRNSLDDLSSAAAARRASVAESLRSIGS